MPAVKLMHTPPEGVQDVYQSAEKFFGHVPNLVKAMGSNKNMCTSITEFMIVSLGDGRVNWALKELIILKTLLAMGSHYSFGAHEKIARDLGVPEEKIGDLNNSLWKTSPHFSESERLVFDLIDQIGVDANDVDPELWKQLNKYFDHGQLIEINAIITTFIMIGRVGDALGVSDPVLFSKSISKSASDIQSMKEPALVAYANALGIAASVSDLKKDTLEKVLHHLNLN